MPVLAVTHVGYTDTAVATSFVMPVFVAFVAFVAEAAEPSMLVMPVSAIAADARFKGTEVVPINTLELPRTALGIVPDRLPAVSDVRLAPDTAPKEPLHVPEVTVPTAVRLEVTIPEASVVPVRPVPATFVAVDALPDRAPENVVAVSVLVFGLYVNGVVVPSTVSGRLPDVALTNGT